MDSIVRMGAFVRGELVSTLRQPRLLLVLVLGPFLVLFIFGLGYEAELPTLSTVVVGNDDEVTDQVDDFLRTEQPATLDYEGTTNDLDTALQRLRDGDIDLVVVLPEDTMESVAAGERAKIEVHQRSLDPVTFSQIAVAADSAVSQINDQVLEEFLGDAQRDAAEYEDQLTEVRAQLDTVRDAVDDDDIVMVQRTAGQVAPQLSALADTVESAGGTAGFFGFGQNLGETVQTLRNGATALQQLSTVDGVGRLDDAAQSLEQLDEVVTQLTAIDPAVAVRPFQAEIVSQTPVAITLNRFFAPGLVALMLQHLGITFAALALVRERQVGAIEMLRVAPVSTGERLAGKTIAFVLLGGIAAVLLTLLIRLAFEVPPPSSWLAFAGLVALTVIASLGIGFLVAAVSTTHSQAVQFSMLLFLTAVFFSGLFMPLDRIGMPVEIVSWLMPATYAFEGLQELMLLGEPARVSLYLGLAAIAVVTFVLARILVPRRNEAA
jgi:ABC-2 type transport system permease protein